MTSHRSGDPNGWRAATVVAGLAALTLFVVISTSYQHTHLSQTWSFFVWLGLAFFMGASLVLGPLARLGESLAGGRALGVGVGAGAGSLLLLVTWLRLSLDVAAAGVVSNRIQELTGWTSSLGLAGLAAAVTGSVVAGLAATAVARSRRQAWSPGWLLGPALIGALALYWTRDEASLPLGPPFPTTNTASLSSIGARNLLLISIDTLRADHLSHHGYPRRTSPRIDGFTETAVVARRVITQKTNTEPSMATVMTGTYPPTHRVLDNHQVLHDANLTLSEILASQGLYTAAVVDNPNLTSEFNFDQGFDELHYVGTNEPEYSPQAQSPIKSQRVNDVGLKLLSEIRDRPFFLWLHYADPHTPYLVPPDLRDLFLDDALAAEHGDREIPVGSATFGSMDPQDVVWDNRRLDFMIAQYDAEIRFNDRSVGEVFDALDTLSLWDDTLVVLTADHGESLGEHDYYFEHGDTVYEPTAHVPLALSHPGLPGGRTIPTPISLVDLPATVLELLGFPPPPTFQGQSFAGLLTSSGNATPHRPHHFIMGSHRYGYQIHGVTTESHKLILEPLPPFLPIDTLVQHALHLWLAEGLDNIYRARCLRTELYDLRSDPLELSNLAGRGHPEEESLEPVLWQWMASTYAAGADKTLLEPEMDEETLRKLEALGYLDP